MLFQVVIPENLAGERLDKALVELLNDVSRSRIQAAISGGNVAIGGEVVVTSKHKVSKDETYMVTLGAPTDAAKPAPQDIPLEILFEDEYLLIINKPAGLAVHPGAGQPDGTLVNALLHYLGEDFSCGEDSSRPGIVHRLDQNTSGSLVVAKQPHVHAKLAELFATHDILRQYVALCYGNPLPTVGTIETHLGRHPRNRVKMAVVDETQADARHAITHYQVEDTYLNNQLALVRCELETGRTHQIRVHMAHKNWNIVGDPVYTRPRVLKNIPLSVQHTLGNVSRQMLHAQVLGFVHPITEEELQFETPLPQDFEDVLNLVASVT